MFENPRRGRQVRNFKTNVPKILDLKSSSEQIFSENRRWVPLSCKRESVANNSGQPQFACYIEVPCHKEIGEGASQAFTGQVSCKNAE